MLTNERRRAVGLLPPEHVTDTVERLQPGAGDQRRNQLAVGERQQLVLGPVDHQRRRRDLRQPGGRVVGHHRARLQHHQLDRRRILQRRRAEQRVARRVVAEVRRQVELPAGAHRAVAVAARPALAEPPDRRRRHRHAAGAAGRRAAQRQRAHAPRLREDQLLSHHPAHRDAQHVGAADRERIEQRLDVGGEVGHRERSGDDLLRQAGAAVVGRDHLEVALQRGEKRLAPPDVRAAEAHDQHQRLAAPAADVSEQFGHGRPVALRRRGVIPAGSRSSASPGSGRRRRRRCGRAR